jgi:hypothetical protein
MPDERYHHQYASLQGHSASAYIVTGRRSGQYQQQSLTRGNGGLRMAERTSSEPQKIQEKELEKNALFRYLMKGWKD